MKKPFAPAAAVILLLGACTAHTLTDKFAPTPQLARSSGVSLSDLQDGHAIFMTQCSQCHEQRIPNAIPTEEWHKIVPGMAWNAGLSKEEQSKVEKYIFAASKVQ